MRDVTEEFRGDYPDDPGLERRFYLAEGVADIKNNYATLAERDTGYWSVLTLMRRVFGGQHSRDISVHGFIENVYIRSPVLEEDPTYPGEGSCAFDIMDITGDKIKGMFIYNMKDEEDAETIEMLFSTHPLTSFDLAYHPVYLAPGNDRFNESVHKLIVYDINCTDDDNSLAQSEDPVYPEAVTKPTYQPACA